MDNAVASPKNKRMVVYSSPFIPAEWIAAHGLVPCRRSFVGTRYHQDTSSAGPVSAEAGVCPYMRGFINEAAQEPRAVAIVLTTTCDQMRRGADLLSLHSSVPFFLMNIPSCFGTLRSDALYFAELERLGNFLVTVGGSRVDVTALGEIMLEYETARRLVLLRKSEQTAEGARRDPETKIPVGFIGGPLAEGHLDIFDVFAAQGADVVFNGTESGERVMPARFDLRRIKDEPVKVLAESYFGVIPDVFERPNKRVFAWMEKAVQARKVRGVVFIRYVWCDKWHSEVHRFREALEVPLLDIELDGGCVNERTRNRIGAFMEGIR